MHFKSLFLLCGLLSFAAARLRTCNRSHPHLLCCDRGGFCVLISQGTTCELQGYINYCCKTDVFTFPGCTRL
ncbi:hypothetical protein F5H01DRAFT_330568 [Linnemannia elongata]|nr:hypothetical protein F5H01DRAFT_330568 [Linnemannia elongata]